MYNLRAILLLTAVYLALTANLQLSNIVAGLLLSAGSYLLFSLATPSVLSRILPATTAPERLHLIALDLADTEIAALGVGEIQPAD